MELVDSSYAISLFTKSTLTQFGWNDGDPIPADLGPLLVKLRETLPASPRHDVLVDIAVMPQDAVAQVQQLLQAAKAVGVKAAAAAEAEKAIANLNPAAQALYRTAAAAVDNAPQFVDDRAAEPPPPPTEPPPPPAEPAPPPPASDLEPMVILPFCPRCGWDMRQKFEIVPTEVDKEDFVAALLGGTRFKRNYDLLGGKLKLCFQTIMADDNKMLHRQLILDQEAKKIVTEAEWFVSMMEYRLALSLEYTTDSNGKPLSVAPALGELPPKKDETPLETLRDYVNKKILVHEVTRRLAGQHLRQFQRLVETLEAMALEPSFWNGIEQQP
jgi:hypothetical protein